MTVQKEPTQEELLSQFIEKLNETLNQMLVLSQRLTETEKVCGYLLSKDPEWIEQVKAAMTKEQQELEKQQETVKESDGTL